MPKYLGIDTSNYTTSAAVYDSDVNAVKNIGKLLPVAAGAKGIRQSDAVFLHTKALPDIVGEAIKDVDNISAVGVSSSPRDMENSYMPCFLSGVAVASGIASALKCPNHRFSHQRGHIAAALFSVNRLDLFKKQFIAFHVSGGTTDAVLAVPNEQLIIECRQIASTTDLNAGQLIDRVGVMLGLKFPAGMQLEELAAESHSDIKIKATLKDGCCCFSGVENQCKKMLDSGVAPCDIAKYTLDYIAVALEKMTDNLILHHGDLPLVFAGGVMSNKMIKKHLSNKFNCLFAQPQFSRDNAAGIAVLTALKEGAVL